MLAKREQASSVAVGCGVMLHNIPAHAAAVAMRYMRLEELIDRVDDSFDGARKPL